MEKVSIEKIQELINKKAEQKAREHITKLTNAIHASGLLDISFDINGEKAKYNLWSLDLKNEKSPLTILYNRMLKKFIESETKDFLTKVESLVEQADTLLSIADNYA